MSDLDFHLKVGDKVQHVKHDWVGIITRIDEIPNEGLTRCDVQWCDQKYAPNDAGHTQWSHKLKRAEQ